MYFQNAFGGGGSPSAFTSPGMNPQALAMLMAMQNMSPGGPKLSMLGKSDSSAPAAPALPGPQMPPSAAGGMGGGMPQYQDLSKTALGQMLQNWLGVGQMGSWSPRGGV